MQLTEIIMAMEVYDKLAEEALRLEEKYDGSIAILHLHEGDLGIVGGSEEGHELARYTENKICPFESWENR